MTSTTSLERFSPRALNLIATLISGQETRVALSRRLKAPGVTVLESRTVMLAPDRTDLYDLVLCARLLRYRPERQRVAPRKDRIPSRIVRSWTQEAHESLLKLYPGIGRLAGRFKPGPDAERPQVVWSVVEYEPLSPQLGGPIGQSVVPGVEITGADDYSWLRAALQEGRLPTETVPGLEGVPVATVPLTLTISHAYGPRIERLETYIAEGRTTIQSLIKCYQRKSETLQELTPLGRRTLSGTTLDPTRLVDAVLARHTPTEPKLFKKRSAIFQPVFDPRQHLVVMGLDLNDLRHGTLDAPSFSHRFLAWVMEVYRTLEVDFAILGFSDSLLELDGGGLAYVHAPVTVKGIDEPFDGTFWNRLAHVLEHPPGLPGEPACYHPLQMRSIGRLLERESRERKYSYRTILFGARRAMPAERAEFHTTELLARTARLLDEEIEDIRQRFEGTLDTLGSFIPYRLKEQARRGGAVAAMFEG